MNFFFGLNLKKFDSLITVPKFTNEGKRLINISLYSLKINKNFWATKKCECEENDDFLYLNNSFIEKDNIFFLSNSKIPNETNFLNFDSIRTLSNINTSFTFRASLKLYNELGQFSSYQSEYPIEMAKKRGAILTPVSTFLNKNQNNFLVFRQIYEQPVQESFKVYLLSLFNKKIILEKQFKTNSTNFIDLTEINNLKDCFFYSEKYLGIPIFISFGNREGISLEHSHPPHIYLLSANKFDIIGNLKNEVKEIVS